MVCISIGCTAVRHRGGPEWQRFLAAVEALQEADAALFEGIADHDAEEIERAVVDELARRGYLAHTREIG